ncbi:CRISPR-associated protein Cas4 [Indiicoccus explosivorum]|uniref:CRISPR-associated protein Cas4 n=1 Tax=Indiicoccus explosivorum TaxID=1917864 RepID=UPI000B43C8E7|nr:CRISPR-associated protein Cas4 [Indiicoccus explosivorum]
MTDYNEDDFLMLSGIQHFVFCRRQWALIHIEQQWEENVRTVEGQHVHRRADQPFIREKRGDKLIIRALPIHSKMLGVSGICDVVEFIRANDGIALAGEDGKYIPTPVEYKRGKPKKDLSDVLQLTAQAMCLEEMLLCEVKEGAIYYNEVRDRLKVPITVENRAQVKSMFREMHSYYSQRHTPKVRTGPFCKNCSLINVCMPALMNKRTVSSYIEGKIQE